MSDEILEGSARAEQASPRAGRLHPALFWFVLYSAASGAVEAMTAAAPGSTMLLFAVQAAVGGFLIFWWASDDARRRGRPLSRLAPLWIVLFGACWIVVRLFGSRAPREARRGLARGLLVALASTLIYVAFFNAFARATVRG